MNQKYTLEITCLSFREKPIINKIKFNSKFIEVYPEHNKIIEIPSDYFKEDEAQRGSVSLYKDNVRINECIIDVLKGYNHCYCILDEKGYTIQLLTNQSIQKIEIPINKDKSYDIIKYDTNSNKYRKRFTLLNLSNFSIIIDDEILAIPSIVKKIDSYQFSIYDTKKNLIVSKPLFIETESIYSYYRKYNSLLYDFQEKLNEYLKNKGFIKKRFLSKYQNIDLLEFLINKSSINSEEKYESIEFMDFITNFSLFKLVKYKINNSLLKEIIECFTSKVKEIANNNSLKLYQKLLLIEKFTYVCCNCNSKTEINNAKFTFYLMDKKEYNSVLWLIEQFFKEFRDKLIEESPIFEKLIELEGEPGIYENELFYCFNMLNLDELKKHLKEIENSILVTIYLDKKNKKNISDTFINSGILTVNVKNIKNYEKLEIPLDKKLSEDNEDIGKIVAAKIIYYILNENKGKKKYLYKQKNKISSINFIKQGKIYVNKNSNIKGKDIVKINSHNNNYFYKLCYGKINDIYTYNIMNKLNDFSDLLTEADLWVNNLELLKEYIKYKYALQQLDSKYKSTQLNIKDKINDYKEEFNKLNKEKIIGINAIFKKTKIKKNKKRKISESKEKKIKWEKNEKKEKYAPSSFNKEKLKMEEEFEKEEIEEVEQNELEIEEESIREEEEESIKEEEEESIREEEEEEEEGEKTNEDKIEESIKPNDKIREKIFLKIPLGTLLNLEKTGIFNESQIKLFRKRRAFLKSYGQNPNK